MLPVNYAILRFMTTVDRACVQDIIDALGQKYNGYKAFTPSGILNSLMTAEANGLLDEVHFDFDSCKNLRIFYSVNDNGRTLIGNYVK